MIAISGGSITEPQKLGPFIDDETRAVEQLKAQGVMKAIYRRTAGPGVVITLEGESMDAIRDFRDHSWAVHVPRGVKDRALQVNHELQASDETGDNPSAREPC